MRSEVVEFKIGVPIEGALKFRTGKPINTRSGLRVMFTLADGRVMFLDPPVAEKIQSLKLSQGQPFQMCRVKGENGEGWRITPVKVPVNGNGHAVKNGVPYLDPKTEWLHCADEAIEALVTAREHATAKGLPVQFTGEDLRQVTAVLYIDAGKTRRMPNYR
jgi:hypothetical protein